MLQYKCTCILTKMSRQKIKIRNKNLGTIHWQSILHKHWAKVIIYFFILFFYIPLLLLNYQSRPYIFWPWIKGQRQFSTCIETDLFRLTQSSKTLSCTSGPHEKRYCSPCFKCKALSLLLTQFGCIYSLSPAVFCLTPPLSAPSHLQGEAWG